MPCHGRAAAAVGLIWWMCAPCRQTARIEPVREVIGWSNRSLLLLLLKRVLGLGVRLHAHYYVFSRWDKEACSFYRGREIMSSGRGGAGAAPGGMVVGVSDFFLRRMVVVHPKVGITTGWP